jgi:hypothetical protein
MSDSSRPSLFTSAYPLLLSVMAGGAMVDQMYSRAIRATLPPEARSAVSSQVQDALLMLALPVLIAGGVCVLLSAGRARQLFVASIAIFSLEFVLPALAGAVPSGAMYLGMVGPFLRMLVMLGALAFAFMAACQVAR